MALIIDDNFVIKTLQRMVQINSTNPSLGAEKCRGSGNRRIHRPDSLKIWVWK